MTKETRAKVGETTFKAYKEITKIAADAHLTKEEKDNQIKVPKVL